MSNTITLKQLSELLDLTPRRIQQLSNEGVVVKELRGKYSLTESVRGYINYLNQQIPNKASVIGTDAKTATEISRSKLVMEKAAIASMDRKQKEGSLLLASDVRLEASRTALTTRRTMLSLPDRLAPVLVDMHDSREIRSFLRHEITEGLRDISKQSAAMDSSEDNDSDEVTE